MTRKFRKDGSAHVCMHSAERHFRRKNGEKINHQISIIVPRLRRTDKEMEIVITELKSAQRKRNKQFRNNLRRKTIERIFGPKDTDVLETKEDKELGEAILGPPNVNSALSNIKITRGLDLRLDPRTGNSTVLLGSSKKGKSTLLMWIYRKYYKKKAWITTLFSINSQISTYKGEKDLLKCNSFDVKAQKYIRLQKFINRKTSNRYNFANLIDDVIDVRHNKLITNMVLTYRNSNISTVLCMQYSNLLSKSSRANFNNVIIFGFNSDESMEVVIKTFLRSAFSKMGIKRLDDQIRFFKKMTKDHQFLYYHPASDSLSFHKIILRKKN